MKRFVTVALAFAFVFAAANAYACGEKNSSAKANAMKADAKGSQAEVKTAEAGGACESGAKAMTADVKKTDGVSGCTYMKGASDKASLEKSNSGCCPAGKTTKASNASQKAEVTEEKTDKNPVLIMSAPVSTGNQQ
jgi:hypothetical protein